jgi:hypothetical protein
VDLTEGTVFEGRTADLAVREVQATVMLVDQHGRKASHRAAISLRLVPRGFEVARRERLIPLAPEWRRTVRHPIKGEFVSPPRASHAILMDQRGAILWWAPLSRIRQPRSRQPNR